MELQGKRAAVLVEQMYQEMEVWYPIYRLKEAGCKVTIIGPEAGQTYPSKLGYPVRSDKAAKDVSPDDFDVVIIPGGEVGKVRDDVPTLDWIKKQSKQAEHVMSVCNGAITLANVTRTS